MRPTTPFFTTTLFRPAPWQAPRTVAPIDPTTGFDLEIDRLFDAAASAVQGTVRRATGGLLVDAREDASGYTIDVAIPGVPAEQIDLQVEDGVLTIRADMPARELAEGERVLFRERAEGSMARRFRLPKGADPAQVQASHALGVLTIRIAKQQPVQPRKIAITG